MIKLWVFCDSKDLAIDAMAIKTLQFASNKQKQRIAALIAKFSENFIQKNLNFERVWFGYYKKNQGKYIHSYFVRRDDGSVVLPPEGMVAYESHQKKLLWDRRNPKENFYTKLLASPELVTSLSYEALQDYRKDDLLYLIRTFSSKEQLSLIIRHFIQIVPHDELVEMDLFHLACQAGNVEAVMRIIHNVPQLVPIRHWPNALMEIFSADSLDRKMKETLVDNLSSQFGKVSISSMLNASSPDKMHNALQELSQSTEEELLVAFIKRFSGQMDLYKTLTYRSLIYLRDILFRGKRVLFSTLLEGLRPLEIIKILTSSATPLLLELVELSVFQVIFQNEAIPKSVKRQLRVLPHIQPKLAMR